MKDIIHKRKVALQYYYNNKNKILEKQKEKFKNMSEEDKIKKREYQRNYYHKVRKHNITPEIREKKNEYFKEYHRKKRNDKYKITIDNTKNIVIDLS